LQYKSDPGIWITFAAFAFIIVGVLLASIPHRRVWASVVRLGDEADRCEIVFGGSSVKAKTLFYKQLNKVADKMAVNLHGQRTDAEQFESAKAEGANV